MWTFVYLLHISLICAFLIFSRFRTAFDGRKREQIRNAHMSEIRSKYQSSKQINSQKPKTLLNRYYLCVAKFGAIQLKSLKTASMFSNKIYRYFWRFSTKWQATFYPGSPCLKVLVHVLGSWRILIARLPNNPKILEYLSTWPFIAMT
jgi:hypothetical protein